MAARNRKQRSQATVTCTEQNGQFTTLQGGSKPRGCRCCSKLLVAMLLLYTAVPFLLRFSPRLQAELVYFNFIDLPLFVNLSDPESFGLTQTRSFFLQHPTSTHEHLEHGSGSNPTSDDHLPIVPFH